ncbi:hypothetical protein CAP2UW1_3726 [Candidatus Accumulibacter phosphatis]|uniref:Uncharacterized protein n=1 Tax=Accumulibacter regalis TaxID=522306 RepID=C7RKQ8_ACCRE
MQCVMKYHELARETTKRYTFGGQRALDNSVSALC